MEKNAFAKLKRTVSVEDVADHFHLEFQKKGKQLHGNCPFVNHGGDRNSGAFAIDTEADTFFCHTHCGGGGGPIDFYCHLKGLDPKRDGLRAYKELYAIFISGTRANHQKTFKTVEKTFEKPSETPKENPPYTKRIDLDQNAEYLLKNKRLTPQTIRFFGVGRGLFGTMKDHIAVPVHNAEGQRIGYAGQNLTTKKWRFHFNKSIELFNFHRVKAQNPESVILVEGFYSVMYLWQSGFTNAAALMGRFVLETQLPLIRSLTKNVVLFFDNDFKGKDGLKKSLEKLEGFNVKIIQYPDERIKPIEFDQSELKKMLS